MSPLRSWFSRKQPRRKVAPVRLGLESLENRLVPTVVFNPQFGAESIAPGSTNDAMQNPPVYFIFAGSYWTNTTQGKSDEATLTASAQSLLSGPYLSGLTQYGSDGKATFAGSFNDSQAVGKNPSTTDLGNYITQFLKGRDALDSPGGGRSDPIYVVISDPNSDQGYNGGFNAQNFITSSGNTQPIHMVWVGTNSQTNGNVSTVSKDNFTLTLSHELAETISDPDSKGIQINPPSTLPFKSSGNQIGDYEPEPDGQPHYSYRLDGNIVQPYWSAKDQAYIVPDGNTQKLYLDPIWSGSIFTAKYNLNIQGDQLGRDSTDSILVSQDSIPGKSPSFYVYLNGEYFAFDANSLKTVNINTGGGTNYVTIQGVPKNVTLNVDSKSADSLVSNDLVDIDTGGSLLGIQGAINVRNSNASGHTKLEVSTGNSQFVDITNHSVGLSAMSGSINYGTGVDELDVIDEWNPTFVEASSVSSSVPVYLYANAMDFLYGPAAYQVHREQEVIIR